MPPAPVNGSFSCTVDKDGYLCSLQCLPGLKVPYGTMTTYRCDFDSMLWSPDLPNAHVVCTETPTPTVGVYVPQQLRSMEGSITSDGFCFTWGQNHYRTFDGLIYDFHGSCSYLLLGECQTNRFKLHIRNKAECHDVQYCKRSLTLYVSDMEYNFNFGEFGFAMTRNEDNVPLPVTMDGLRVETISYYIVISSALGFTLRWDGKEAIFIQVDGSLRNKTCGLCGTYNADSSDDLTDIRGDVVDSVSLFGRSYKMNDVDDSCEDSNQLSYCHIYPGRVEDADELCKELTESNFAVCHSVMDPTPFYNACREDVCKCNASSGCECSSYEAYARECARNNVVEMEWRNQSRCPVTCPGTMIYKQCGSSCPSTCKKTFYQCLHNHCMDGCQCPDNTLLHGDTCVAQEQCPCQYSGREYSTGSEIQADDGCNTCRCEGGTWTCTSDICTGTCSVIGGVHYQTFDGRRYNFVGECTYVLATHRHRGLAFFSISMENHHCSRMSHSVGGTCTRSLIITYDNSHIKLTKNMVVVVHGEELDNIDLPFEVPGIYIEQISDEFQQVTLDVGVVVLWNGGSQIYIDMPPDLFNQTCGLCGTFDKNQENDFWTLEGDIEKQPGVFAEKWTFLSTCANPAPVITYNPCDVYTQRREQAHTICQKLREAPFTGCHATVDVESYFFICTYDLCNGGDVGMTELFCNVAASYSMECSNRGHVLIWKDVVPECGTSCEINKVYQECGPSCQTSCPAILTERTCEDRCIPGCSCPPGLVYNYDGSCLTVEECPCMYNDRLYAPGQTIQPVCQPCTCVNGVWDCIVGDCDPPVCGENMRLVTCKSACVTTCSNMHLPQECTPATCARGCQCLDGYVYDGDRCILPEQCPCHHGGQSYDNGDTITVECNKCVCNGHQWECDVKECPGMCSSWGDSHTKTFDGKMFEFFGECVYVLSRANKDNPYLQYNITSENILCSTTGITCSKTIVFSVRRGEKDETVQLQRDGPITVSDDSKFVIWQTGLYLFVKVEEGITLIWDKGTRVYIRLEPKYRGLVEGLCGNFNGNQADDFLTPFGGPPTGNVIEFSDSWKLYAYCGDTHNTNDSCFFAPHRRPWATRQCSVLKSDTFAPCHTEVDPEPYYERCVFDACACNTGGDCECFCTAVATYAQECNLNGVSIRWRSQEMCPMQCEGCGEYQPCITACPRTCDNYYKYNELECTEPCIEGCLCPEDEVYEPDTNRCIPESQCYCKKIGDIKYYDGQTIPSCSDACMTCYCFNHTIHWVGQPCMTFASTSATMLLTTEGMVTTDTALSTTPHVITTTAKLHPSASYSPPVTTPIEDTLESTLVTKTSKIFPSTQFTTSFPDSVRTTIRTTEKERSTLEEFPVSIDQSIISKTPIFSEVQGETTPGIIADTFTSETLSTPIEGTPGSMPVKKTTTIFPSTPATQSTTSTPDDVNTDIEFVSTDQTIIPKMPITSVAQGETTSGIIADTLTSKGMSTSEPIATSATPTPHVTRARTEIPVVSTAATQVADGMVSIEQDITEIPTTQGVEETYSLVHTMPTLHTVAEQTVTLSPTITDAPTATSIVSTEEATMPTKATQITVDDSMGMNTAASLTHPKVSVTDVIPGGQTTKEYTRESMIHLTESTEDKSTIVESTYELPVSIPMIKPPLCIKTGWTDWMNVYQPGSGPTEGDFEIMPNLRIFHQFCRNPIDVECRNSDTLEPPSFILGQFVQCFPFLGLQCFNNQQALGLCADYEVRFKCECDVSTISIPTRKGPTDVSADISGTTVIKATESETSKLKTSPHITESTTTPNILEVSPTQATCTDVYRNCTKDGYRYQSEVEIFNVNWDNRLSDRTSCQFINLANDITETLHDIYSVSEMLKDIFICVYMNHFSKGSVIARHTIVVSQRIPFDTRSPALPKNITYEYKTTMSPEISSLFSTGQTYTPRSILPEELTTLPKSLFSTFMDKSTPQITQVDSIHETEEGIPPTITSDILETTTTEASTQEILSTAIRSTAQEIVTEQMAAFTITPSTIKLIIESTIASQPETLTQIIDLTTELVTEKITKLPEISSHGITSKMLASVVETAAATLFPKILTTLSKTLPPTIMPSLMTGLAGTISKESRSTDLTLQKDVLTEFHPTSLTSARELSLSTSKSVQTEPRPTGTTEICKPGYTEWMNTDTPLDDGDDIESIEDLRLFYIFCDTPIEIECRDIESDTSPDELGQTVTCDVLNGLLCYGMDQEMGVCKDYKVRFHCGECSDTCGSNEILVPNAFTCKQLCHAMQSSEQVCKDNENAQLDACLDRTLIARSHSVTFCNTPGNLVMEVNGELKCIPEQDCLCLREDTGTMVAPGSRWEFELCETCTCFNNEIVCVNKTTRECNPTPQPEDILAIEITDGVHVTSEPLSGPTVRPVAVCANVTDISNCPESCQSGHMCDGKICLEPAWCPCYYENNMYKSGMFINSRCETCNCFNSEVTCVKRCVIDECQPGQILQHLDGECCQCVPCKCEADEYHCSMSESPTCSEQCISRNLMCDGTPDCLNSEDELNCPTETPGCTTLAGDFVGVGEIWSEYGCRFCECLSDDQVICNSTKCSKECSVYLNSFSTFDDLVYEYDMCDHVMVTNSTDQVPYFVVKVVRICVFGGTGYSSMLCKKELHVNIRDTDMLLRKHMLLHINGQYVRRSQLSAVSGQLEKTQGFSIIKSGQEYIIKTDFGLVVHWNIYSEITLEIDDQLYDRVAGMCGIPNSNASDDLTMSDAAPTNDVLSFGDSWGNHDECPQPEEICMLTFAEFADEARRECEILRSAAFAPCHSHVDIEPYIERCEQLVCEFLYNSTGHASDNIDDCLCEVLTIYATDCANTEAHVLLGWRSPDLCPVYDQCNYPMIWYECLTTCEWTCTTSGRPWNDCPTGCTPGCGCTPGLVRKGDTCVKPDECTQCYCYGYGGIHYFSFDGSYFAFEGNCTYMAARDSSPNGDFEILVENEECNRRPQTMCFVAVIVRYHGNEIRLENGQKVVVNGVEHYRPPQIIVDGIHVSQLGGWSLYLRIPDINLEVSYYDYINGFGILMPGTKYLNATEGLCGPCNRNPEDDRMKENSLIATNDTDFALSWLQESEDDNQYCVTTDVPRRVDQTQKDRDKCRKDIYEGIFKQCNLLVDPLPYYRACLLERACHGYHCDALASYAMECSRHDLCLDWREEHECPAPDCEDGREYDPCHVPCVKTCVNEDVYNVDICSGRLVEGCFCPPGTIVDDDGECVQSCDYCTDVNGIKHMMNETWQPDACQTCICYPGGNAHCTSEQCMAAPLCSEPKRLETTHVTGECCPVYQCVCDPLACPPESFHPTQMCNHDRDLVDTVINECCTKQECVCRECDYSGVPTCQPFESLDIYKENTDDCCNQYRCVCNPVNCPPQEVTCPTYKEQVLIEETISLCCPQHECVCSCPEAEVINCQVGYAKEEVLYGEECDCIKYSCVKKEVCVWNNTLVNELQEVQPGSTNLVGDNPCRVCECLEEHDPVSDFYQIQCDVIQCAVNSQEDCDEQSEYLSPESGVCCGRCQKRWCVDGDVKYEIGDKWPLDDPINKCDYNECVADKDGTPLLYPFHISCESVSADCKGPAFVVKNDTCCPYCALAVSPCKNVVEEIEIEVNGCHSNGTVEWSYCEGRCSSWFRYSYASEAQSSCMCCYAQETSKRRTNLLCDDSSIFTHEYDFIESCVCSACVEV
ncbi:uncharacterized protein LOC100366685 [Saccoglossus kowalevskii]